MSAIRILVVDDEPDLLEVLRLSFRGAGMEVLTAPSGNKARAILEKGERVDALLTDIRMGDGTGIELIEAVSAMPMAEGRPVMTVMSGFTDMRLPELLARGGAEFFGKPFDRHGMIKRIAALVAIRRDGYALAETFEGYKPVVLSPKDLVFGSGGVFCACTEGFREGELVRCKVDAADRVPALDLLGKVRWVRFQPNAHFRRGIAVETLAAGDEGTRQWLNANFRDEPAVIPIGAGRDSL